MNPVLHHSHRYCSQLLRQFIKGQCIHSSVLIRHENPLGLPKRNNPPPPTIPRRGIPQKRRIPHVKYTVIVASGKGGVGKSTVAVNLAFALALHTHREGIDGRKRRPRVGILDLDIFGPSIPKLMGLDNADEPLLTSSGAIVALKNHGISCMSMGFLLPHTENSSREDTPVVWRGLMVQKAVQQLLFDIDWREGAGGLGGGEGLDVLVVDMPPGTGDVALTLGQLVESDGAVIVSTPQDVSLADVRKGVAMFRKVSIPILGVLLNTSYFICPSCTTPHRPFGSADKFMDVASQLGVDVLAELPLVSDVSEGSDRGIPYMLTSSGSSPVDALGLGGREWREGMANVAEKVWTALENVTRG